MIFHLLFIIMLAATLYFLWRSFSNIFKNIKLLKKPYSIANTGERIKLLMNVAIGQTKIMRFPIAGIMHALVFWGFCVITVGSAEMVFDGVSGVVFDHEASNDRLFGFLGPVYSLITASGDVFAFLIFVFIVAFLVRRQIIKVKRFEGVEMRHRDHRDAAISLSFILLLMVSLLGMNTGYVAYAQRFQHPLEGVYPISTMLAPMLSNWSAEAMHVFEMINWWMHITLICLFANYLPYSKHFHVFMSLPNVYFARTEPLTKMANMPRVTNEVKLMMNPETAYTAAPEGQPQEIERFGVKDVEDGTWKNYIDSLTCTQCGRCTSVCPANQTGKKLSPRKIVLDYRRRMEEKQAGLHKNGKSYDDGKSLLGDYVTAEELWACTTCNACAQECPVNIDQPSLILDMRRFLVMEQSAAPSAINMMSTFIENNGAPWQYSPADRFNWANDLYINEK